MDLSKYIGEGTLYDKKEKLEKILEYIGNYFLKYNIEAKDFYNL